MSSINRFEEILGKIDDAIPTPIKQMKQDAKTNLNSIIEGALQRMNLVTREEFDIQTQVLLKTRARLEALEKQVSDLEHHLSPNTASPDKND